MRLFINDYLLKISFSAIVSKLLALTKFFFSKKKGASMIVKRLIVISLLIFNLNSQTLHFILFFLQNHVFPLSTRC